MQNNIITDFAAGEEFSIFVTKNKGLKSKLNITKNNLSL